MWRPWKSILLSITKRILETGILLCLVTIVSIFVFGGFKTILGIKVSATTPLNPITFLFLLTIIRIVRQWHIPVIITLMDFGAGNFNLFREAVLVTSLKYT